jgi:tetratricopeptide (TPR) repeat protein
MRALTIALLLLGALAHAADDAPPSVAPPFSDDPDSDAARRHFDLGLKHYDAARFTEAIREFDLARQLKPAPAFDYNIGRCHERLEAWGAAADAYTRYLAAEPRAPNAAALRARLEVLRARAQVGAETADLAAVQLVRVHRRTRIAAWTFGGLTVALAGAGLGAYLAPLGDYRDRERSCRGGCPPEALRDLAIDVRRAEIAAGVLWGAAGLTAVADIVLWTLDLRQRRTHEAVKR